MLTLERPHCGVMADITELSPGYDAHLQPRGSGWAMAELMAKGKPGPLAEAFNMWRFKDGQFIDESVAAGVAH